MAPLRLGTRGSPLAVAQSSAVARAIEALGVDVELVRIATSGDPHSRDATSGQNPAGSRVSAVGGAGSVGAAGAEDKARFVKEIEEALLADEIDLAVHSAKDVPGELPDGLEIAGVPARADPRDALCLPPDGPMHDSEGQDPHDRASSARGGRDGRAVALAELPGGAVVGTASLRRRAQLLALRPDLDVTELRGNVDTRLRRLAEGDFDALVLAAAGLSRLGRHDAGDPISETVLVPAPGQGCLALEARTDHARAREIARQLTDPAALTALTAERALVTGIDASCHTPVGAHATLVGDSLQLATFVGAPDGSAWVRDELAGPADDPHALGAAAAERLVAAGARDVLATGAA